MLALYDNTNDNGNDAAAVMMMIYNDDNSGNRKFVPIPDQNRQSKYIDHHKMSGFYFSTAKRMLFKFSFNHRNTFCL